VRTGSNHDRWSPQDTALHEFDDTPAGSVMPAVCGGSAPRADARWKIDPSASTSDPHWHFDRDPANLGDLELPKSAASGYRLSLIHGSAPFRGPQRTLASPESSQRVPLLMALNILPVRLLIGDDVGIGKTIESGLILSGLMVGEDDQDEEHAQSRRSGP